MRKITLFNSDWLVEKGAGEPFRVDLPHTVNALDGQDGQNDYYRGLVKYRKTFTLDAFDPELDCYYLEFQGVNSSANVYLNDQLLSTHHGGYSTFRVLLNDALQLENNLLVEVDNSVNDTIYPQKADFTFYNGIYRDVNLIHVNLEHFELVEYGGPGVKITPHIEGQNARVEVETFTVTTKGEVLLHVHDQEGQLVAETQASNRAQEFLIHNARLWDGLNDPHLYTLTARLIVDGEVRDEIKQDFGVRTFRIDPKKGFFLNGRHYPLHGVSRHQDREAVGNAISKADHDQDMALIQEIGANSVRLAHYQHDQYFYDLCDRAGMVVWAEIPYISEHLPNARKNSIEQMEELIAQNYNHASIVMWGVSNEITISTKDKYDMLDNHQVLIDLVNAMDPTRLTTLASYAMCTPFNKTNHMTDVLGYNLYLGWYVPGLFLNDLFIKFFHLIYPNRPLSYAEYGAEGLTHLHSENPKRTDHTEEYQAIYHEYMVRCFTRHPYMWGSYVWNMFDFGSDARNQGGVPGKNHKGLITFDRSIKKDSFYLYKVHWNPEPMVHINSKRFVDRHQDVVTIKVYSNQPSVSLYQNGKLLETQQAEEGQRIFKFAVRLEKENTIEARAGELIDEAYFRKTDAPNPDYILDRKLRKSSNWV